MKAFKRLFKRKSKTKEAKSDELAEKGRSVPKPILKQSTSGGPTPTPVIPMYQPNKLPASRSETNGRTSGESLVGHGAPKSSKPDEKALAVSLQRKSNTTIPAPMSRSSAQAKTSSPSTTNSVPKSHRSNLPPTAALASSSSSTGESNGQSSSSKSAGQRSSQKSASYKGVSESFKGLSGPQRFGVGDGQDSQPPSDLNKLEKLGDVYDSIPELEQTKLPRGGISIETQAVGRVQFGIPPETIKDSMNLGIPVPQVYIVPAERFCREMGPALGVNLAEFEFPGYFNYFVYKKRCTLVVDSQEAEDNICRVFNETLLGPAQFRRKENPIPFEEEDFSPEFPRDAIPNLEKELRHFRIMPDGTELAVEVVFDFAQFKMPGDGYCHDNLGVPPNLASDDTDDDDEIDEEELNEALNLVGDGEDAEEEEIPADESGVEKRAKANKWSYKKARWVGDVATVWPPKATEEEKRNRSVPRVEIFKMPSGTEYIIHDVDVNNIIIGKARFSGHVKVSETIGVAGFVKDEENDQKDTEKDDDESVNSSNVNDSLLISPAPPTFHPPSFGLTTLGNSHGFDKMGSVSGYVLWINGRGIMIDPPPYSSATLEREGIRPRTIVGIILTHCHADHDAGAFQKVLTGSPVVVITTPTIYKSFIRKYAALASLSPSLLRHSHRYKPAIIGEPLRFQGATFHFTYSLHVIPCVGFRVEWRGRSMVFTGDHLNIPEEIDRLQEKGVLSKARAEDLKSLPLQETDLLLHEAGTPPVHTPIEVLMKLPARVKKRLYVVHTSSIPPDCDLRVAPVGTAGTLRLDQVQRGGGPGAGMATSTWMERSMRKPRNNRDAYSISLEEHEIVTSPWSSASNEYAAVSEEGMRPEPVGGALNSSFSNLGAATQGGKKTNHRSSMTGSPGSSIPLVSLRPASSTDAWFILNLLSAVPFLSSLSYASTMEVLETARVDAYCKNDVVLPANRRSQFLCVVWEGTCVERDRSLTGKQSERNLSVIEEKGEKTQHGAVWHAGDWTGPIALQPEKRLSGESDLSATHDIVAMANEGVKVITIDFTSLHQILKSGSKLYSKYLERRQRQQQRRTSIENGSQESETSTTTHKLLTEAIKNLNVLELLDQNSALRKLSAVQKRHLESLAEGPTAFGPGERLWRAGAPVDKAFMMVAGTASFVPRRRNAGSASAPPGHLGLTPSTRTMLARLGDSTKVVKPQSHEVKNVGAEMEQDVMQAVQEMNESGDKAETEGPSKVDMVQLESLFSRSGDGQAKSLTEAHDFAKLSKNLQKRAEILSGDPHSDISVGSSHDDSISADSDQVGDGSSSSPRGSGGGPRRSSLSRRRSSRARFANKVLGRLYSRRAFTGGLVFSRGHFLGDVSKMVAGLLSSDKDQNDSALDNSFPAYGFGDKLEGAKEPVSDNIADMVIHEQDGDGLIVHSSTLTAGKDGCVVLVFPKASLIPFLDEYPGLLLSLLGTQVVV